MKRLCVLIAMCLLFSGCDKKVAKDPPPTVTYDKVAESDVTTDMLFHRMVDTELAPNYSYNYNWTYNVSSKSPDDENAGNNYTLSMNWHVDSTWDCRHLNYTMTTESDPEDQGDGIEVYTDFKNDRVYSTDPDTGKWTYTNAPTDNAREDTTFGALSLPWIFAADIDNLEFSSDDDSYIVTGQIEYDIAAKFIRYIGDSTGAVVKVFLQDRDRIDLTVSFDKEYALLKQITIHTGSDTDVVKDDVLFTWDVNYFYDDVVSVPKDIAKKATKEK